jgi:hypothetical protein
MRRLVTGAIVLGCLIGRVPAVRADEIDKQAAQEQFAEGQRAFAAGDFRHAAEAFEEAYRKKPHYSPLWNAARSWQKAGESTRAANLYARYLREAPATARDRDQATASLAELAARLGRIVVQAQGGTDVRIDGKPVEGDGLYVPPGEHVVEGKFESAAARRVVTVDGGKVLSVTLEPPRAETPDKQAVVVTPPPPRSEEPGLRLPWTVVLVGGVLTAAGAGVTIWSGLDTNAKRRAFDGAPTQANLDDGKDRQLRTNIALAVTGGLAVLTGVAALFVDWGGSKETGAGRVSQTTSSGSRAAIWARPYALGGSTSSSLSGGGLAIGGRLP